MTLDAAHASRFFAGAVVREYGCAVVAVLVATLIGLALGLRLDAVVVAPFLAAVAVSAAAGGFGPALVATGLSAVACYRWFLLPLRILDLDRAALWRLTGYRLGVFVAAALAIAAATGFRRRAEDELRRSMRRLLPFVADGGVGLWEVTEDGVVTWADDAACALVERTHDGVVGLALADLFVDGDVVAAILACVNDELSVDNQRARIRSDDGVVREVLVNASGAWRVTDVTRRRILFATLPVRARDAEETLMPSLAGRSVPGSAASPPT